MFNKYFIYCFIFFLQKNKNLKETLLPITPVKILSTQTQKKPDKPCSVTNQPIKDWLTTGHLKSNLNDTSEMTGSLYFKGLLWQEM